MDEPAFAWVICERQSDQIYVCNRAAYVEARLLLATLATPAYFPTFVDHIDVRKSLPVQQWHVPWHRACTSLH